MDDELLAEYDFASIPGGVRGKYVRRKYVERYRQSNNLVRLDPDVAAVFPDEPAVNEALRMLMNIAKRHASSKASQDVD